MSEHRTRPGPVRWLWYAYGGGLPLDLSPWVLADVTGPTWVWRHLTRAVVQLMPVLLLCLLLPPVPLAFRLTAAGGGLFVGLLFSLAYMTETTEHRAVKAGYAPGTTGQLREARAERRRAERAAPFRAGGRAVSTDRPGRMGPSRPRTSWSPPCPS